MHVLTPDPSVHPPTFPHPDFHSPALLELLKLEVTEELANYLAETVVDVVNTAVGNKPTTRDSTDPHPGSEWVLKFKRFAQNFIRNASVGMPTFLVALVYIAESRPRISAEEWGHKGVFLGALIVASKYTTDHCFRTDYWVRATVLPGKQALNQATVNFQHVITIERNFLKVLGWKLGFTQKDILLHYSAIIRLYEKRPPKNPSPLSPQSYLRTATRPPTPYPKDVRAQIRISTTSTTCQSSRSRSAR